MVVTIRVANWGHRAGDGRCRQGSVSSTHDSAGLRGPRRSGSLGDLQVTASTLGGGIPLTWRRRYGRDGHPSTRSPTTVAAGGQVVVTIRVANYGGIG